MKAKLNHHKLITALCHLRATATSTFIHISEKKIRTIMKNIFKVEESSVPSPTGFWRHSNVTWDRVLQLTMMMVNWIFADVSRCLIAGTILQFSFSCWHSFQRWRRHYLSKEKTFAISIEHSGLLKREWLKTAKGHISSKIICAWLTNIPTKCEFFYWLKTDIWPSTGDCFLFSAWSYLQRERIEDQPVIANLDENRSSNHSLNVLRMHIRWSMKNSSRLGHSVEDGRRTKVIRWSCLVMLSIKLRWEFFAL